MLSDGGRLVFAGLDESDRQGVYDVTFTFGPDPIASVPKLLVQVGQTLSAALGGGTVTEVATLDLARNGELLVALGLTDGANARWSTLVLNARSLSVAELCGSLSLHARRALERDTGEALPNLATHWGALNRELRLWLLERARNKPGVMDLDTLVSLLAHDDVAFVVAALGVLARLPKPPRSALPYLRKLVVSTHAEIRFGALAAGGDHVGVEWRTIAKGDESPVVRALAVERWGAERGRAIAPDLARCLRTERDWRPRAALTEALARMGDVGVEAVTPLLTDGHDDARAAAVTIMLRNGREAWLAARFLA